MIHTARIDLDNFAESDSTSLCINLDVFSYFYEHGYPVDEILEAHSAVNAKPDDENSGHLVVKLKTLSKPLEQADASVDTHTMYACDCKSYTYHTSVDLEEKQITEWEPCKHIESVDPSVRAANDPNQEQL